MRALFKSRPPLESLYFLIPIAIFIVAIAVAVFFWAVKSGQYDDLDTEGRRILFDEPDTPTNAKKMKTPPSSTSEETRD